MLKKASLLLLLAVLLVGIFGYGVARLFILRYEQGNVYPPYSSLRADPLGAKGIYDGLGELPGIAVRRNFKSLPKLKTETPITLVYAGVSHYAMWEEREVLEFDRIVLGGTRAVLTFLPIEHSLVAEEIRQKEDEERRRKEAKRAEEDEKSSKKTEPEKKKDKTDKDDGKKEKDKKSGKHSDDDERRDKSPLIKFDEVGKRWGLAFDTLRASDEKSFDRRAVLQDQGRDLDKELSWHSALTFKNLKPEWKVLYTCENQPVVIERSYGQGTIVLATDSFFLSNEALRVERHPLLLSAIFNGPPDYVFDEEHHGIRDDPGIASLARKYRLHGVVAGLVLLAILFVWKNVVRFLPPLESDRGVNDVVLGKESSEGFVNLLRRTIPTAQILEVCLAEWRKSLVNRPRGAEKVEQLYAEELARPTRARNPVDTYRAMAKALSRH